MPPTLASANLPPAAISENVPAVTAPTAYL